MLNKKILVVDDDAAITQMLALALNNAGYQVVTALEGLEGFIKFETEDPYMVFTDVQMPGMDGLELLRRIRKVRPEAIVVVITGFGSEERAMTVLKEGGANYLKKPVDIREVCELADRYWGLMDEENQVQRAAQSVENVDIRLRLDNDPRKVPGVAQYLASQVKPFLSGRDITSIKLGLYEIIMNAIEHGNLEIDYRTKSRTLALNTYSEVLRQRQADERFASRRVAVELQAGREGGRFTIIDEGAGFDWRVWIEHDAPARFIDSNGRGLLMALLSFDEIDFNEKGNRATLIVKPA